MRIFLVLLMMLPFFVFTQEIEWKTINQENITKEVKPILVEVHTTWCSWCKMMDKTTLKSDKAARYINKNFTPIRFDAQQKDSLQFFEKEYRFNGYYNELTYFLLNNHLEFPAHAILTPEGNVVKVFYGYLNENDFLKILKDYKPTP